MRTRESGPPASCPLWYSLYQAGLLDHADVIAVTSAANVARGLNQRMDITADLDPGQIDRTSWTWPARWTPCGTANAR